jgi:hypothetical protein
VLLIVAHALRHVQSVKPEIAPAPQPTLQLTPELIQELRALLLPTTVSEEHQETPQLSQTATTTEIQKAAKEEPQPLLLSVSEDERNKVIAAHKQGIPRREICSYLRWGSSKYSTIVKPLLEQHIPRVAQRAKLKQRGGHKTAIDPASEQQLRSVSAIN